MKFSLLIANYNNGKFFKDCMQGILAQTHADWEAIIVDDASTDDSLTIIRALIKDEPRCRLHINEQNRGVGYTKHRCVQLASASWCGFIDPDDVLLPNALTVMQQAHEQYNKAVLLHATLIFCDEQLKQYNVYKKAGPVDTTDKMFFNLDGAVAAFAVFCKAAYAQTGGIDLYMQRAVDQDMYIKLAETGSFHFVNEALYLYRRNPSGISTNSNVPGAKYWHWYAAMQGARRRGVNLEGKFIESFVVKKEYDHLQHIINESGVYKLAKWLGPVLKLKSGK